MKFILPAVLAALMLGGCATGTMSEKITSDYKAVPVGQQQLEYRVYLPPQYESEPGRHFPLLVYFHGGGGNHRSWGEEGGMGERVLPHMRDESFGPFIVLAPSVGRYDVITGLAETELFQHVIPQVKASYRTNEVTVAFGHSMGGLSALMLGLRHPHTFSAVAAASPFAYDVSPYDSGERVEHFKQQFRGGFFLGRWQKGVAGKFQSREEFDAYSPFQQIRAMDSKPCFSLFLTTGTKDPMGLYAQNELLHRALASAGIAHEYVVQKGVAHSTIREPRLYQWLNEQADKSEFSRNAGGN